MWHLLRGPKIKYDISSLFTGLSEKGDLSPVISPYNSITETKDLLKWLGGFPLLSCLGKYYCRNYCTLLSNIIGYSYEVYSTISYCYINHFSVIWYKVLYCILQYNCFDSDINNNRKSNWHLLPK